MVISRMSLAYMPEYNAFGIADSKIESLPPRVIPVLSLSDDCYDHLGIRPPVGAPKVGFLMGREENCYTIDFNYAYAIVASGMEPVLMDYFYCTEQLFDCSGLILPGGSFESPAWYYSDDKSLDRSEYPNKRSKAYGYSLYTALHMGIPILGICAGAQVMAAEFGSHLVPKIKSRISHKTKQHLAHRVHAVNVAMVKNILGVTSLDTNSRHSEGVKDFPKLDLYAVAEDGCPEMWGSVKKNMLGVQWHPEDFVVVDNLTHKKVYDWLAERARNYQRTSFISKSFVSNC